MLTLGAADVLWRNRHRRMLSTLLLAHRFRRHLGEIKRLATLLDHLAVTISQPGYVTNVGVANRQRLTAFFGVGSATLAWLNGDWRLRASDAGSHAGDVVPACLRTPTPTGGVPSLLDGFVPYGS
jgi:hypothetical protein